MTDIERLPAALNVKVPQGEPFSFKLLLKIKPGATDDDPTPVAAPVVWADHQITSDIVNSGSTWQIVTGVDGEAVVTLPTGLAQATWTHWIALDDVEFLAGKLRVRAPGTTGATTLDGFTAVIDQGESTFEVTFYSWGAGGSGGGGSSGIDGGAPDSNFGGTSPIDGGNP